MADRRVLDRIAAWEAGGLIDADTAARLRTNEAERTDEPTARTDAPAGRSVNSQVAGFFGPAISIVEVFAYLGAGFVVAAWHTLASTLVVGSNYDPATGISVPDPLAVTVSWLIPAVILAIVGIGLSRRSDRERRAAGVAFAVATAHVYVGVDQLAPLGGTSFVDVALIATAAALLAALAFRRIFASILTHAAALVAAAGFAATLLTWLDTQLFGEIFEPRATEAGVIRPIATIGWWLLWALGFGLLARSERTRADRSDLDESARTAAARRAIVSRFAAGLTAVLGTTIGSYVNDEAGRVIEPWAGELAILAVAVLLIGVALRFGSSAYLYPAALGIIIAFTDLNQAYIAEHTGSGVALLIEGAILIGAGFGADRVRRRVEATRAASSTLDSPEPEPEPEPVALPLVP
jgi:hypothetical protein